jgi:predicted nuclease of predicted toxin-antitoxin system
MRFLLDQDVYAATRRFLQSLGHDVITAAELGRSRASDEELLRLAAELGRVFVTRDRDFGALVFVKGRSAGVIYLRVLPATLDAVHAGLARVLESHPASELATAFVAISTKGYRLRAINPPRGQT